MSSSWSTFIQINDILKGQNIIGFIKKQRLNRLGHVEHMAEDNIVQKMKRWKPMSKRSIGIPKTRWKDYVLEDTYKGGSGDDDDNNNNKLMYYHINVCCWEVTRIINSIFFVCIAVHLGWFEYAYSK